MSQSTPPPAVAVAGLEYDYADGTSALAQCDLTIPAGEKWGIIGANGAGKTTLLLLLDGLLVPSQGEISVFGQPLTDKASIQTTRRELGIVFQNPDDQLFSPTVFDDVVFGPLNLGVSRDEAHDRAHAALARVDMAGYEERVPQHLSGGEKRAVSIATVLAMEPRLILLDEPTSNLDPRARKQISDLLSGLGATLVIASHDFELLLESCDQVALLGGGRVAATGPPHEVLGQKELLEENGLRQPSWLPGFLEAT